MPQVIYTGQNSSKYVGSSSRYLNSNVIQYDGKLTFTIYRKKTLGFSPSDRYYDITEAVQYRPDKVSKMFYGTPEYWWKIMEMNGMKDVLDFKAGTVIRLPGGTLM